MLDSGTRYFFDSTTQLIFDQNNISLLQGTVYIARGQFSDWLLLLQACEQGGEHLHKRVSETLDVCWDMSDNAVMIQDPSAIERYCLTLTPVNLESLENLLIELHQGCCEPIPFNFVADIIHQPDSILGMLQTITNFPLSGEQLAMAKQSLSELAAEVELTMLDLCQLWEKIPALTFFAKVLRFYFVS